MEQEAEGQSFRFSIVRRHVLGDRRYFVVILLLSHWTIYIVRQVSTSNKQQATSQSLLSAAQKVKGKKKLGMYVASKFSNFSCTHVWCEIQSGQLLENLNPFCYDLN
jgi:hypothetical protein